MHIILHNAAHDIPILAELFDVTSEELMSRITFEDTMVMSYVLRLIPQGLKPLERRYNGRKRQSYVEVTREADRQLAADYLRRILTFKCSACSGDGSMIVEPIGARGVRLSPRPVTCDECDGDGTSWPPPDEYLEYVNGEVKVRRGQKIGTRVRTALRRLVVTSTTYTKDSQHVDDASNEEDVDDDTVENEASAGEDRKATGLRAWWMKQVDYDYRVKIEDAIGPMPEVTLDDVVPQSAAVTYSAEDADGTMRIYPILKQQLEAEGLTRIYEIDRDTIPLLVRMMEVGTYFDVPYARKLDARLEVECDQILYQLQQTVGHYVNPASPKQVAELLFDELNLPIVKETKTGDASTQDKVLEDLKLQVAAMEDSKRTRRALTILGNITDHRERMKLRGTYTLALPRMVDKNSRIHTTFKSTRTETNRLSSANPNLQNCFSGDTEVLTYEGWTRFDELSREIHVAQWREDGVVEFVVPTDYVRKTDNLIRIHSEHIDLQVTPTHRCLIEHRKTGERRVIDAQDYPEDWRQLNAGNYAGGDGVPWSDDELRLLVAMQADGSWASNQRADFTSKKLRKIERFRALLASCNVPHRETLRIGGASRFYIQAGVITKRQYAVLGPQKLFNWSFFLALSRGQIDVILAEVMFWDGCWTRKNHYASKHKHNADVIATLFTLSGVRANVRKYVSGGGSISWQVDVTHRNYSLTTNRKVEESERGKVYCCSVPSSYLLVRRNGKTMVTGNCPARSDLGMLVRGAFAAPDGYSLVSVDLSQIEVRVMAHLCGDKNLIAGIKSGVDVHIITASHIFRTTIERVTKKQRTIAKRITFLILYGGGAMRLRAELRLEGIEVTVEETQTYIDAYLKVAYPGIEDFMDEQCSKARRYGYVETLMGWRRYLPGVHSDLDGVRMEAERMAVNAPVQGTAAEIMRMSCPVLMDEVYPEVRKSGWDCDPLLTVHDEVVSQVKVGGEERLAKRIVEAMTGVMKLKVPILAEWKTAKRWSECK